MKAKNYFKLLILATLPFFFNSCDNGEEGNRCFTVKVLVVEDDTIFGEIEQVPEHNVLKEDGREFKVFPGTKITFPSKDIGFKLSEGDIIDIKITKCEQYKGPILDFPPIIAHKVKLCK